MLQALTDRLKQETNPNIARPIPYLVTSYTTCKEHLSHFKNMCSNCILSIQGGPEQFVYEWAEKSSLSSNGLLQSTCCHQVQTAGNVTSFYHVIQHIQILITLLCTKVQTFSSFEENLSLKSPLKGSLGCHPRKFVKTRCKVVRQLWVNLV